MVSLGGVSNPPPNKITWNSEEGILKSVESPGAWGNGMLLGSGRCLHWLGWDGGSATQGGDYR